MTFDDILGTLKRETITQQLILTPVKADEELTSSKNMMVLEQVALYQANDAHKQLVEMMHTHQYQEAKTFARQQINFLNAQLQNFPDSSELKIQLEAIVEIYSEIDKYKKMDARMQKMSLKHYGSSQYYVGSKKSNHYASRKVMRSRELDKKDKKS